MEKEIVCPVCKGAGQVPNDFYSHTPMKTSDTRKLFVKCDNCGGRGKVYEVV